MEINILETIAKLKASPNTLINGTICSEINCSECPISKEECDNLINVIGVTSQHDIYEYITTHLAYAIIEQYYPEYSI